MRASYHIELDILSMTMRLEQHRGYCPYGKPWLEPEATMSSGGTGGIIVRPGLSAAGDASEHNAGVSTAAVSPPESDTSVNCFLFGDKERTRTGGLNDYRFPARDYVSGFPRFTTVDPMCGGTPWLSPYAYCAGNPVMYTDPTGEVVDILWDVFNLIYDAGAALYSHATGDHANANEHWIDAGADLIAAAIPGVPAGMTKLARTVAGTAEKAAGGAVSKTASQKGLRNAAAIQEGKNFEKEQFEQAVKEGKNVVGHKKLVLDNGLGDVKGNRTIVDQLIKNKNGKYTIIETKRTDMTPLSAGQKAAQRHVGRNGANFQIKSDI